MIASTDERYRPLNARTGPDGALYIADMYHGIIEHVIFMVPWVADQIKARKLEEGNYLGRLWRIVYEGNSISRKAPNPTRGRTGRNPCRATGLDTMSAACTLPSINM